MDNQPLSVVDMDGMPEALLTLVAQWDGLPFIANGDNLCWNNHDFDRGIGFFPTAGAVYLKKYIDGSFVGQVPFAIQYRTYPVGNKARIDSQRLLEDLGIWLERCTATLTDSTVQIIKLERTSNAIKLGAYEDGSEVYQNTMNITYTKRR